MNGSAGRSSTPVLDLLADVIGSAMPLRKSPREIAEAALMALATGGYTLAHALDDWRDDEPTTDDASEPFTEGWLDRQIERSTDTIAALPEGLRRSMGLSDDARP